MHYIFSFLQNAAWKFIVIKLHRDIDLFQGSVTLFHLFHFWSYAVVVYYVVVFYVVVSYAVFDIERLGIFDPYVESKAYRVNDVSSYQMNKEKEAILITMLTNKMILWQHGHTKTLFHILAFPILNWFLQKHERACQRADQQMDYLARNNVRMYFTWFSKIKLSKSIWFQFYSFQGSFSNNLNLFFLIFYSIFSLFL